MTDPKTTHEALEQLTPHELEVLRKRFGIPEKTGKDTVRVPPGDDEDGGSGGVPAPAPMEDN